MNQFELTVELLAPVLSAGVGSAALGVDTQQLFYQDTPVIPGSLLRGVLRHAWRELMTIDPGLDWPVEDWLGIEGGNRGKLIFPYFFKLEATDQCEPSNNDMVRIAIDSETETAKDKMLQIIRSPWPAGTSLKLRGTFCYTEEISKPLLIAIEKAMYWAGAIGAEKGVGFGRVVRVNADKLAEKQSKYKFDRKLADGDRIKIALRFDRPVCFAKPHNSESANRFDSENHMPGAALLAVLKQQGLSAAAVDKLKTSHFCPSTAKPIIPVSWAYGEGGFVDAARQSGPFVFKHENGQLRPPRFAVDWKDKEQRIAAQQLGAAEDADGGRRWLEIRTAIQANSNRAATGQLFSINSVQTSDDDPWAGELDISSLGMPEKKRLFKLLNQPLLGPFGKTDALAQVELNAAPSDRNPIDLDEPIALMLSSDAALVDSATQEAAELSYRHYWAAVIGSLPLMLEQSFIDESLGGGDYLYRRFDYADGQYRSQIIARAGSVFVLRCTDTSLSKDVQEILQIWLRDGLPDAPHFKASWRNKPWSSANGYGRVVLAPKPPALAADWAVLSIDEQESLA